MTHPLTPREKVAAAIIDSGVNIGTSTWPDDIQVDALRLADAILTALASGSGDHAELARLAEWRDRLRADPGRAAHFGSPYADKPMHNGRTYWNSDLAEDITTLIAEVAALRGENDRLAFETDDATLAALQSRATEAERKLAEAVELLREWMGTWFVDADGRGENAIADDTRKFLSKEAERG